MTWQFFIQLIWGLSIVRSQYEPYGENVAYRKPANQSSTYGLSNASLGVDGRISTDPEIVPCSHTGEGPRYAWWTVDLEGFYFIKFIRIYQWLREGKINRLDGSQMYGKYMDNTWKQINFNSNWPPSVFNVSVELNRPIGEIMLNNSLVQGAAAFICVCELQAFKVIECAPFSIANGSIKVVKYGDSHQNFTFETKFNVTCYEGYRMSADGTLLNETESIIECNATGNWSRNLTCSVTVCERPLNIPTNSKEILTPGIGGNNTYNATITVECNEGYNYSLHEIKPIRCASDGLWRGNLGNCNVIECGRPLTIPGNSTLVFSTGLSGNTSYNSTFTIHCNTGLRYTHPGNETIRCGNEGHWTGYIGKCEAIECSVMFVISNGDIRVTTIGVDGRNNTYGAKFAVQCDSGFSSNVQEITCLENGLSDQPVCNAEPKPIDLTAVIVGSVVTLVILVTLVVGIVIFMRRRKKHNDDARTNFNQTDEIKTEDQPNEGEIAIEANANHNCYENIHNIRTNDIKIEDFFDFVLQRRSKSNLYEEEYKQATRSVIKSKDVAMQVVNKDKNRYKGMVPYDDNRVKLHVWDADRETDYINASFIDGFNQCQEYVAAQGPMENTLNDFWRMIWQLKTTKIVMLTNLTEGSGRKCMQYWPDEGSVDFGKINVQLIQTDQFSEFIIRTMKIKMNDCLGEEKSRIIKQFHFTTWPDKSVPRYSSSMVHFRHKIYTTEDDGNFTGPLVVHCSAGVGRTGTFIAIDVLVNQAQAQGTVNVTSCLESLRNQRVLMIQTLEQFIFVHEVLVEALTCTTYAVSARDFQEEYRKLLTRDPKHQKILLQLTFEKLQLINLNTDENTYAIAKETGNRDKNRYCNILPDENYRPNLSIYVSGRNSYINAVFLPAYKENDAFIVTQTPLENTIVDFWRMVYQYDVSSIVMLNTLSEMKDNERYWPQKRNVFNCPPFEIRLESEESFGCCNVSKLILIYKEEQRNVRLSRARYWTEDERVPKSPLHLLEHVELLHGWQTESAGRNPVVVHCMNGAERSGLFCVIAAVLERTKIEQDVAIEQIVRELRHRRSQIIPDLEQFRFCHDAVLAYLNQNDTYANF